jgi:hypothetical protein
MRTSSFFFGVLLGALPFLFVAGLACSTAKDAPLDADERHATAQDAGPADAGGEGSADASPPTPAAPWRPQDVVARANADHPHWIRPDATTNAHLLETKDGFRIASAC